MGSRRIGPFELEKQLGAGGMGVVYLARYVKDGRQVALKVLTPAMSADKKLARRFQREINILSRLDHKNIVKYYGGGAHGSQQFYAMEYINGGTLQDALKKKRRLSWEQTIDVTRQVAQALEHAHYHGIVHRDLKPANLFLTKKGRIKLGDFGIARDTEATALTAAGKTVGTYAYMAPEQISGKPPVSRKTDLYSLGCVIYEMLTGRPPFEAQTAAEMLMHHLEHEPPRPTAIATDCPVWLENLVLQCLEKDPEDRPWDALAVQVSLDEIGEKVAKGESVARQTVAGGSTAVAAKTAQKSELQKLLGRRRKKKKKRGPFYEQVWFLATCLVLLIAGVYWLMRPLNKEQLYERAQSLMASEEREDWRTARDRYLQPLLQRFPESEEAAWAESQLDKIEMDIAERQAKNIVVTNREPKSIGQRMFVEGLRAERAGDRITALQRFRSMLPLLKDTDDRDRYYRMLAAEKVAEIQQSVGENPDLELINDALRRAETHFRRGEKVRADALWSSIITHYAENREFDRQVAYARARRDGEKPEPLDFGQADGTAK